MKMIAKHKQAEESLMRPIMNCEELASSEIDPSPSDTSPLRWEQSSSCTWAR
jgi:hypothetical protein